MATRAQINIQEPSVRSLLLIGRAQGKDIGTATGFVATYNDAPHLVTNWHVAAGRSPTDGQPISPTGAVPDELVVLHNTAGQLGSWIPKNEPLYDQHGDPLWLEHPSLGRSVDVIALPLTATSGVDLYPYDPANPGPGIIMGPSDPISIIGFPFGLTGGGSMGMGIWIQGTLASEPGIDWNNLPCFLIDARTRPGSSGSPAILFRPTGFQTATAAMVMTGVPGVEFVGIYSGRINQESDLGIVWKVQTLIEILNGQHHGPLPTVGPPP